MKFLHWGACIQRKYSLLKQYFCSWFLYKLAFSSASKFFLIILQLFLISLKQHITKQKEIIFHSE